MDKVLLNRANKFANSKANTLSLNQKQLKIFSELNKEIKTLSEKLNELSLSQLPLNQKQIKKLSELKKGIKTLSEISNIQQLNDQ